MIDILGFNVEKKQNWGILLLTFDFPGNVAAIEKLIKDGAINTANLDNALNVAIISGKVLICWCVGL